MFKRGNTWYVRDPFGVKVSTGTTDKGRAEALEQEYKAERWNRQHHPELYREIDSRPKHTLGEAVKKWLEEHQHQVGAKANLTYYTYWLKCFGADCLLSQINRNNVHEFIKYRTTDEPSPKNWTANCYVSAIKKLLNTAAKVWNSESDAWYKGEVPSLRYYPLPPKRSRVLSVAEWLALDELLGEELRNMAKFSLFTLLRESNVLALTSSHIRQNCAYFGAEEMKARLAHSVPLNKTAQAIIERCGKDKIGMAPIFTYQGKQLKGLTGSAYRDWQRAVDRSGIDPCRFHDLRRTGATWLIEAGISYEDTRVLGGWKLPGVMESTYIHRSVESLRPKIEVLDNILVPPVSHQISIA